MLWTPGWATRFMPLPISGATAQLLNTYPPDYKIIFVGDASMSPYEIAYPGGSVEHWN